jgi:hypothetical protein
VAPSRSSFSLSGFRLSGSNSCKSYFLTSTTRNRGIVGVSAGGLLKRETLRSSQLALTIKLLLLGSAEFHSQLDSIYKLVLQSQYWREENTNTSLEPFGEGNSRMDSTSPAPGGRKCVRFLTRLSATTLTPKLKPTRLFIAGLPGCFKSPWRGSFHLQVDIFSVCCSTYLIQPLDKESCGY